MRKNFGKKTWFYPMPVLIVGSYDEQGNADAMNAAWGGVYDANQIMISLSAGHKTTKNIKAKGEFTVSFADAANVVAADYVGMESANDVPNKLEKAGWHAEKSGTVDAPIIKELPLALECKLVKFNEDGNVIGEIVGISADESILGADGEVDPKLFKALGLDPVSNEYRVMGEAVGHAFKDGAKLK